MFDAPLPTLIRPVQAAALAAALLFGASSPDGLEGQERTSRIIAIVEVPELGGMELSGSQINFLADLSLGGVQWAVGDRTTEIRVRGNTPMMIRVRSVSERLVHVESGEEIKPASDMEWRVAGSGDWVPLATQRYTVAAPKAGEVGSIEIEYRIRIDPDRDPPGAHVAEVEFEVTPS